MSPQFSTGTVATLQISLLWKLPINTTPTQHCAAYNNTEDGKILIPPITTESPVQLLQAGYQALGKYRD